MDQQRALNSCDQQLSEARRMALVAETPTVAIAALTLAFVAVGELVVFALREDWDV